jgi:hypothetical protein
MNVEIAEQCRLGRADLLTYIGPDFRISPHFCGPLASMITQISLLVRECALGRRHGSLAHLILFRYFGGVEA